MKIDHFFLSSVIRGIKLLYFKLSFKLKELKDNTIGKYLNNLLLKPSQNNIDSPLINCREIQPKNLLNDLLDLQTLKVVFQ